MDNKNGEENTQNQQQQMAILQQEEDEDGISVPNWLLEVLAWMSRMEMANSSLSYSCKLFYRLCWPKLHENVKPHRIERLYFCEDWKTNSGYLVKLNGCAQPLPIPPPPFYILGFSSINMCFLDDQFVEFVQMIFPRLNKIDFSLAVGDGWIRRDEKKIKTFGRLLDLLANKIIKFNFLDSPRIFKFNKLFPGFLQKIHFLFVNQSLSLAEFDIIFDWLVMPPPTNSDKQQKIIEFERELDVNETNKFIKRIKKEFTNATAPRNFYIIGCQFGYRFAHFNMENAKTGEILIVGEQMQIVRCPRGEENRWIEEGQNKTNPWWIGHANETYIEY